jgi:hypothetical protein
VPKPGVVVDDRLERLLGRYGECALFGGEVIGDVRGEVLAGMEARRAVALLLLAVYVVVDGGVELGVPRGYLVAHPAERGKLAPWSSVNIGRGELSMSMAAQTGDMRCISDQHARSEWQ